jgi:hypothetical protein
VRITSAWPFGSGARWGRGSCRRPTLERARPPVPRSGGLNPRGGDPVASQG